MPHRSTIVEIIALVVLLVAFLGLMYVDQAATASRMESGPAVEPAGPPDLAKHRDEFLAGIEALQRQDSSDAIQHLGSFTLRPRAVEQYRLYFLASAYQLDRDVPRTRDTLVHLWRQPATLVHMAEVGFNLASMYANRGAWQTAAEIYASLAARENQPATRAAARAGFIMEAFHAGDPAAMLFAARSTYVESPNSEQAAAAAELTRSFLSLPSKSRIPLTLVERIRRAENLVRDGNGASAQAELRDLDTSSLQTPQRQQVILTRALAHHRLHQFTQSDRILEPLFSDQFRFAEPALLYSARNNKILFAAVDPYVSKTVTERRRTGTRKVKVKGKVVSQPVYRTVKKTVKLVDLNKKKKKEEYERRYVERLKDLLQTRTSTGTRRQVLTGLLEVAQSKKQTSYMEEIVGELAKLDPLAEPALQYFWDSGWAAYQKGDVATARERFAFIAATYPNPNVERQASYWLARVLERAGEPQRAAELFQDLVEAPYDDLYALHAKRRGLTPRRNAVPEPLGQERPDWEEIAEESLPQELRLAYELTALGVNREARLEIQKNANESNRKYADAILGDLYHSEGATILAHRYVRRAWPQLGTVAQDQVPLHFLRVYYPLKFEDKIREAASDRDLDPYLVMALVHQESAFNPEIRSRVGAIGLMQLMPATGRELGNRLYAAFSEARLKNPEVNLELGTYYLRKLLEQVGGSVELALASYNAGPGNVRKWRRANPRKPLDEFIESIPYHETRGYVKRITILRSSYARLHDELKTEVREARGAWQVRPPVRTHSGPAVAGITNGVFPSAVTGIDDDSEADPSRPWRHAARGTTASRRRTAGDSGSVSASSLRAEQFGRR